MRVTGQACPRRRDGQGCAPVNEVVVGAGQNAGPEGYAACSCGRRFPLPPAARRRLDAVAAGCRAVPPATAEPAAARALDSLLERVVRPAEPTSRLSRPGVVPVGAPVLHRPTQPVGVISPGLVRFALHMASVMRAAGGVGLAANQAGAPVRMLAHDLGRIVPQILVDPRVVGSHGTWTYGEGCLSLRVDDATADVVRPKVVTVVATLLDGRVLAVRADEVLARVLQHEVDHLDGIVYVQRLVGAEREAVLASVERAGGDLASLPPRPHGV
ncbi:peptide deformylase [Streptomyces hilarionis]|uniref:peptide deformylase n=1 Tax=Streptomyces hilarionis TaxID=2839954 RepID=UPI00211A8C91|nr:peptide deformylase [Streptomyces hilarionis]MCQ9133708.1 peptide deformylase [Streptomyces hilarionis]